MDFAPENPLWYPFCDILDKVHLNHFDLPADIVRDLMVTHEPALGTSHFGENGIFRPEAAYGLEHGRRLEDEGLPEISLREYFDRWPHKPSFFQYFDRANEGGAFGGILLRTRNLLLSLQWTMSSLRDDDGYEGRAFSWFYINAFNEIIAPILRTNSASDERVIVVYSEYREEAYIATSNSKAWDPTAVSDYLPLPLPEDMRLAGNWSEHMSDGSIRDAMSSVDRLRSFEFGSSFLLDETARFLGELLAVRNKRLMQ
jgi:hypothetical protein